MFTLHFLKHARETILGLKKHPVLIKSIWYRYPPASKNKTTVFPSSSLEKKTTFNNILSNMFSDLPCADIFRVSLREHVRQFSNQLRSGLQFKIIVNVVSIFIHLSNL